MDRKVPITISMDNATLTELERLARNNGTNRSEMVRRLIDEAARKLVDPSPVYSTKATA